MIQVTRRLVADRDLGRVGQVVAVDPSAIIAVTEAGFIPVSAPIGIDADGITHNVNADEASGAVARALSAEKLILLTDVEGVKGKNGNLITGLSRKDAQKLIRSKVIKDGMLPKVNCCLDALKEGVTKTHIVDGRVKHALLLEFFTEAGIGTQIVEKL